MEVDKCQRDHAASASGRPSTRITGSNQRQDFNLRPIRPEGSRACHRKPRMQRANAYNTEIRVERHDVDRTGFEILRTLLNARIPK